MQLISVGEAQGEVINRKVLSFVIQRTSHLLSEDRENQQARPEADLKESVSQQC